MIEQQDRITYLYHSGYSEAATITNHTRSDRYILAQHQEFDGNGNKVTLFSYKSLDELRLSSLA